MKKAMCICVCIYVYVSLFIEKAQLTATGLKHGTRSKGQHFHFLIYTRLYQ